MGLIEATIDLRGSVVPRDPGMVVPAQLVAFARGFLLTGKDTVRFLWRADGEWHAVRLDLVGRTGELTARTRLFCSRTELPQGITAREIA